MSDRWEVVCEWIGYAALAIPCELFAPGFRALGLASLGVLWAMWVCWTDALRTVLRGGPDDLADARLMLALLPANGAFALFVVALVAAGG